MKQIRILRQKAADKAWQFLDNGLGRLSKEPDADGEARYFICTKSGRAQGEFPRVHVERCEAFLARAGGQP